MPTLAISAYGIQLRLGDGVPKAPLTVTAATNTTPITLTVATPHGIVDVDYVTVAGVLGNTNANNETWVAQYVSPTSVILRDSAGDAAYAGGGTMTQRSSFTNVAEITDLQDAGITANLIDVSAHDGNGWSSRIPGLIAGNAIRLAINLVPQDPTHDGTTGFAYLVISKEFRDWMIVLPDAPKTTWAFTGWVRSHRVNAAVTAALTATTEIEIVGRPVLANAYVAA